LGYPGTLGCESYDYIIADKNIIENQDYKFYTEKPVLMPESYQVNDAHRKVSVDKFNKAELARPEAGFVYCCFNNNYKILPNIFDIWMRILKSVEGSVLWLFEDNPFASRNLKLEAEKRGVDSSRLIFASKLPLDQHLARLRLADLFLDTLPYNAHTTASDALWAGLPLLTCPGKSFASRVAASLLHAVELPELVMDSLGAYEAKAIELAKDTSQLNAIKLKLEQNRKTSSLFDGKLFAQHLEMAYEAMFARYQAGLAPDVIDVGELIKQKG
jgi:predicted O-linked N-acetylglucosamine transferase (SPINDLY family)